MKTTALNPFVKEMMQRLFPDADLQVDSLIQDFDLEIVAPAL